MVISVPTRYSFKSNSRTLATQRNHYSTRVVPLSDSSATHFLDHLIIPSGAGRHIYAP